jgi:riboflavin synthase
MFSGIIQSLGTVLTIEDLGTTKHLRIQSSLAHELHIDQSIAHDGVCLTITNLQEDAHEVDVVRETLSKTSFDNIRAGQAINLEKSLTLHSLLDGHLVQGHVDTILTCLEKRDEKGSWNFKFNLPEEFIPLVIPHGSICLHGVSLTVANLYDDTFDVAIIPYTYFNTNFQFIQPGDKVNVEFDLIGKYLLRQKGHR